MAINADWHKKNPMPKHPTKDQRIAWHLAHSKHCHCREIPENLVIEMQSRGISFKSQVVTT